MHACAPLLGSQGPASLLLDTHRVVSMHGLHVGFAWHGVAMSTPEFFTVAGDLVQACWGVLEPCVCI